MQQLTMAEARDQIKAWFAQDEHGFSITTDKDGDIRCLYRSKDWAGAPQACAVGCLIPEDLYDRLFEAEDVADVLHDVGIDRKLGAFLRDAQKAHDVAATKWYEGMHSARLLADGTAVGFDQAMTEFMVDLDVAFCRHSRIAQAQEN